MNYPRLHILLIFLLIVSSTASFAQNRAPIQRDIDYINNYKYLAISEMNRSGVPASITLAQGILESASGTSRLATQGNNHFGIKCHKGWTGGRMYHDDDAKGECFRTYPSADQSFRDHSDFLTGRSRYSDLFTLSIRDHVGWAYGLKKAGYATNPKYPQLLISLIDRYNLTLFDKKDNYTIANYSMTTLNPSYVQSAPQSYQTKTYSPKVSSPINSYSSSSYPNKTVQTQGRVEPQGKITYYPPKTQNSFTQKKSQVNSTPSSAAPSQISSNSKSPKSANIDMAKSYMGTTVTSRTPAPISKQNKRSFFRKSNKKTTPPAVSSYAHSKPNTNNYTKSNNGEAINKSQSSSKNMASKTYTAPIVGKPIAADRKTSSSSFRSIEYNKIKAVIYETDVSLTKVSEDQGTSANKLSSYNDVNEKITIAAGTKIFLESKKSKAGKQFRQHKVRDKETMQDISQNYGVKLDELYDKNQMPKGTQPKAGEYINLRDKRRWTPRVRTEDFTPLFVRSTARSMGSKTETVVKSNVPSGSNSRNKTYTPMSSPARKTFGRTPNPVSTAQTIVSTKPESEKVDDKIVNTLSAIVQEEKQTSNRIYSAPRTHKAESLVSNSNTSYTKSTDVKSIPQSRGTSYTSSSISKPNNLSGNYNPNIPVAKTIPLTETEKSRIVARQVISSSPAESTPLIQEAHSKPKSSIVFTPIPNPVIEPASTPVISSSTLASEPIDYSQKSAEKISDFHMMDIKESDSESFWSPMAANEEALLVKAKADYNKQAESVPSNNSTTSINPTNSVPDIESSHISETVILENNAQANDLFTRESEFSKGDLLNLSTTTAVRTEVITSVPEEKISGEWTGEIYSSKTTYIPPTNNVVETHPASTIITNPIVPESVVSSEVLISDQTYVQPATIVQAPELISSQTASNHRVVKGDTLYNISRRYGLTVAELKAMNGLSDNVIKLGQSLRLL